MKVAEETAHPRVRKARQEYFESMSNSAGYQTWHTESVMTDKAFHQQYLSVSEEKALLEYVLRMADRCYPLTVKFLRTLAVVIARRRISIGGEAPAPSEISPPSKNWPQAFYQRHPERQAKRLRPLDWARHDVTSMTRW
ncbi:hypothetical protein LTR05_008455 [Lithohypha guttulata]|uniref:HTH CENPB-type domain-containing protein n=1 Tax=Lithohypha guttulata TaxID=1690604 RepID=A0AAN7PSD8_9EURO|nr:hypothetical protein LTR05_008455 [Lithohypha guttulata]